MSALNAGIEAREISFGYAKTERVLSGISVAFNYGELAGILGPNGSGKTTLLKLLSGGNAPDAGKVLADGRDIGELHGKALARKISVVPQSTHMDFDMTVLEMVLMGRQPHMSFFERENTHDLQLARDAMRKTDVLRYENVPVTRLSGGEMQRVIIARALCQNAPVMLLDEPVASLDIQHTAQILKLLRELARTEHVCAVCVLHELSLAGCFCDNVALMRGGQLYSSGRPGEVLTPSNIRAVYNIDADIIRDTHGGIRVLPRYNDGRIAN